MQIPVNHFKRAIAAGRHQLGLWVSLAHPYSAEVVAGAGFDWLVFDTEHSPNDVQTVLGQMQAAAPYPVSPMVRPSWNVPVQQKRYLRSEEHTSELQSLMRISYAVFCL